MQELLTVLLHRLTLQGLLHDVPAVLLVGGGEGMGKSEATRKPLDARPAGKRQVCICV